MIEDGQSGVEKLAHRVRWLQEQINDAYEEHLSSRNERARESFVGRSILRVGTYDGKLR